MMLEHTGKHGELVQFGTMKTGPYNLEVEPFSSCYLLYKLNCHNNKLIISISKCAISVEMEWSE